MRDWWPHFGISGLRSRTIFDEATYICDSCGEEIVVPVDPSAGHSQQYVEDCPVCCNPNVITITIDSNGRVICEGRAEQDRD